jgi:hypothetical protein
VPLIPLLAPWEGWCFIQEVIKYVNRKYIEVKLILKINYYRFKGFWFESELKPYNNYKNYKFLDMKYYGIHDSFIDFYTTNKTEVIDKINNIQISNDELLLFFKDELAKFKKIGIFIYNFR